jgi:phosphoribosyl 1,2-cyclic phosphodiesterase
MKLISLQSGSNGNCVYVEADGVRLLFDAGISGTQAQERLSVRGCDVHDVDALLISHDHADHARNMGVYCRKFQLPVYVTAATYRAAHRYRPGEIRDVRHFSAGETLRFRGVSVETVRTPHDGVDGVVFIVDDGRHRLGILTDLGHAFADLRPILESLDAVLLESNYDPELLIQGDYPVWLKQRIQGPGGHLSNLESAELLQAVAAQRMRWACLGHLSEKNNTPTLALETHRRILADKVPLNVASRYHVSREMIIY